MATVATRGMKPGAVDALEAAARFAKDNGADAWCRPKDIGGGRQNRVDGQLGALLTRGYVERREARPSEWRETKLWEYRITAAGWVGLKT